MSKSIEEAARAAQPDQAHAERSLLTPGRRGFLGAAGTIAAGGVVLGNLGNAKAAPGAEAAEEAFVESVVNEHKESKEAAKDDRDLKRTALRVRIEAARQQYDVPIAALPNNGDEALYDQKIGSDTRGLPHDERGEVDPKAWKVQAEALAARSWEKLEGVTLGGVRKLVNPIGTLAASLEGESPVQVALPPAPAIASAERAAEAVEQYWQAVLRDVRYDSFEQNVDAQAAAEELSKLSGYTGPRENGVVTPRILFRGNVRYADPSDPTGSTPLHVIPPGVLDGPNISQFAYRDTPYGTQRIAAAGRVPVAGEDFLIDYDEWLAVQDGNNPTRRLSSESAPRHIVTVRDLNEYTHSGNPLLWAAALQLVAGASGSATNPAGVGAPVSSTNPYRTSKTQASANATFGAGYLQALLSVGVSRAIRAAYFAKWFVHRSVRPEAFGGLVHHKLLDVDYPLHKDLLDSKGLAASINKFGSSLIPHAYPEGAPTHGSYPAGSAATAGVQATLIKAFFDESFVIPNPVTVDPNDPSKLVPYTGTPLTVGGEINKLALNYTFGRVTSGIHWRSDSAAGLALGEQIAISILRDERLTFVEPFDGFKFTKFDGTQITI